MHHEWKHITVRRAILTTSITTRLCQFFICLSKGDQGSEGEVGVGGEVGKKVIDYFCILTY